MAQLEKTLNVDKEIDQVFGEIDFVFFIAKVIPVRKMMMVIMKPNAPTENTKPVSVVAVVAIIRKISVTTISLMAEIADAEFLVQGENLSDHQAEKKLGRDHVGKNPSTSNDDKISQVKKSELNRISQKRAGMFQVKKRIG